MLTVLWSALLSDVDHIHNPPRVRAIPSLTPLPQLLICFLLEADLQEKELSRGHTSRIMYGVVIKASF